MELRDRIQRYIESCPPAISGSGGHSQTFFVACQLANGFCLDESETLQWLEVYNTKCDPPWSARELAHKAKQACGATNHGKARGHLLAGTNGHFNASDLRGPKVPVNTPAPKRIEAPADPEAEVKKFLNGMVCMECDLMEASPVQLDDWTRDGIMLIQNLFQPDEIVNFVTEWEPYTKKGSTDIKANPKGKGKSVQVSKLVEAWSKGMPKSEAGGWFRINPMDGKDVKDKNVTAFRYALIEFDSISIELQLSLLSMLAIPIAAILTSGGKSVHAWVKVNATDLKEYEDVVERTRNALTRFGVDRVNKNPARLSRLVGVTRKVGATGDGQQKLLYLNPDPVNKPIITAEGITP